MTRDTRQTIYTVYFAYCPAWCSKCKLNFVYKYIQNDVGVHAFLYKRTLSWFLFPHCIRPYKGVSRAKNTFSKLLLTQSIDFATRKNPPARFFPGLATKIVVENFVVFFFRFSVSKKKLFSTSDYEKNGISIIIIFVEQLLR